MIPSVLSDRRDLPPDIVATDIFRLFVENLPEAVLAEDRNRKITFANRRFCEMISLPADSELAGMEAVTVFEQAKYCFAHPDEFCGRTQDMARVRTAVTGGEVWLANGQCMELDYIPVLSEGQYGGCFWKYRDVTRQKQEHIQLLENEEMYHLLSESSRDVVALHCPNYQYLYVSPSIHDMTGYEVSELLGRSPLDYLHPDDAPRVMQAHKHALEDTSSSCIRYRARCKNGHYLWMETHLRIIRDGGGNVVRLQTSTRDISLRIQAENKLMQSEANLRALLETTEDTVYSVTTDLHLIACNSAFVRTVAKYAGVQLKAGDHCPVTLLPPEVQAQWTQYYRRVFAGERFSAVSELVHSDSTVCFEHFFNPILDSDGLVAGASVFGRNITARIEVEKKTREQSQLLDGILVNLPVIVFRATADGIFTYSRGAGLNGLGLTDDQVVGFSLFEIFPHLKDKFDAMYQGSVVRFASQGGEPGNEWSFENHVFHDEDGSGAITGFAWDVSKEKVTEQTLRRYAAEMAMLNADKDKLFSIISHDLRGPLTGVLAITDLLSNGLETLSEDEIRMFASNLHLSASNLLKLLDGLLEWSLNELGRMTYEPQPIDVRQLCSEVLELLRLNVKNKNLSVDFKVSGDVYAHADQRMVQSVLRNLLSNAIKFTPANGKVTIAIGNDETTHTANQAVLQWLRICITDTGMGMDEQTLQNLFDNKVRHSVRGTAGEKGTGLGLSLCRDFVGMHGGRIWAESQPGQGSRFCFTLPQAIAVNGQT